LPELSAITGHPSFSSITGLNKNTAAASRAKIGKTYFRHGGNLFERFLLPRRPGKPGIPQNGIEACNRRPEVKLPTGLLVFLLAMTDRAVNFF
jgi:hypothetical protein